MNKEGQYKATFWIKTETWKNLQQLAKDQQTNCSQILRDLIIEKLGPVQSG